MGPLSVLMGNLWEEYVIVCLMELGIIPLCQKEAVIHVTNGYVLAFLPCMTPIINSISNTEYLGYFQIE